MTYCRLIAPEWLTKKGSKPVIEGRFSDEEIKKYNATGYNVYYLPNHPRSDDFESPVNGTHITEFDWVFVDFDLKNAPLGFGKEDFIEKVAAFPCPPTKIVDSGNGIHAYWRVTDLDAKSYLRLTRRLIRQFDTDEAVGTLAQLMRLPGTMNTKIQVLFVPCKVLGECVDNVYTSEELHKVLPPITKEDEEHCTRHYNSTYAVKSDDIGLVFEKMPAKWGELLRVNKEAKALWIDSSDDRSADDWRLGHILFAAGFNEEEAATVLSNTAKARKRAPVHRLSYAQGIISKIWTSEEKNAPVNTLYDSVENILETASGELEGERFPCWKYIDDTVTGFRLGHVMGLVAGSGVGKTAMALNIFMGFVQANPEYDHFFVPLEQTNKEIALRWKIMCGDNTRLHKKVHIISNYDAKGKFRDLSLDTIREAILEFKASNPNKKVGCVVIDHIGVLSNSNKHGHSEGVKELSKAMKSFAIETNTFLIMQSQTAREKAGIGDIELDKDAAFGTSAFENYCDYLVTIWQPLKRMYSKGAPTIMAFKFCKIRHKVADEDVIKEDVTYTMFFNPKTQRLRPLTAEEHESCNFFAKQAAEKRKEEKKTALTVFNPAMWGADGNSEGNRQPSRH